MAEHDRRFKRLRIYNVVMGSFHAGQGVAIVALVWFMQKTKNKRELQATSN